MGCGYTVYVSAAAEPKQEGEFSMRVRILGVIVVVYGILFLTTPNIQASEWSSATLFGPAVKTVGRTAVTFRSSLYVFASTGQEVVYRQSSDGAFWFPQHEWGALDIKTPSAPAATVLNDTLYLFYRTEGDAIQYQTFDGSTWSSPFTTGASSTAAPAVVTHNNAIVLAWRNNGGRINYSTFNGSSWSSATTIPGRMTSLAPAIASFAGDLYIVVSATAGQFSVAKPPALGWVNISCMGCSVRAASTVSMVVSNGKLLLFTTDGIPQRIVMRVLVLQL
jgi:hypothetical protein